jgi:small-conductance mechanosensitive channel
MDSFKFIKDWILENPLAFNVIRYVTIVIFILIIIQLLRRILKRSLPETSVRYNSQKGIEFFGYIILIILSISYFTGNIKDFTLLIGLFSAGIAFTLQELILSIAGSIYIFILKLYKPGDRIEINGIKGDVIDVDSVYTTMMEIGQWVSSDNYSGRIVKLSNAFVFKGPIYNYSKDFPFIWDEFNLPIHYDSDVELAKSIIIKIASETLSDYTAKSKSKWKDIVEKYYIEDAVVDPSLSVKLTDNWIEFNLRYIVDYKKRRITKNILSQSIYEEINKHKDRIVLASTTLEIIKIPEIKIQPKSDEEN